MTQGLPKRLGIGALFFALFATSAMALEFDVPRRPSTEVTRESLGASLFYVANFTAMSMLLAIALSIRQTIWALYTLLVILGLAYICAFEQNLTGVVWTGVDLSEGALLVFGYAMLSLNFVIAGWSIPADIAYARFKPAYKLAVILIWSLWGVGAWIGGTMPYVTFSFAGILVVLGHFMPVSTFSQWHGGYDRMVRNAIWMLLSITFFGAAFAVATASFGANPFAATSNRAIIAMISACFAFLFIRHIFVLRSEREMAIQNALEATKEQVRVGQELLAARESYDTVRDLARARNLRLASASHDIRQPISSLRTSFSALSAAQPSEVQQHLQTALDYLDDLAASYIDEAQDLDAPNAGGHADQPSPATSLSTQLIAETLAKMFADDATERGLDLEVAMTPATLTVDALPVMRILSNLVTNAIKHASGGVVSIMGQDDGAAYTVAVSNRTDNRMDFEAWQKGAGSDGSGLGLAIVRQQASVAGFGLDLADQQDGEVTVTVTLPLESPP